MVMIRLIWKRVEGSPEKPHNTWHSIAKVAKGLIDLNEILSINHSSESGEQAAQLNLDQQEDARVELEMRVSYKPAVDGIQVFSIDDLSFVLEEKDISDTSTTSSTLALNKDSL